MAYLPQPIKKGISFISRLHEVRMQILQHIDSTNTRVQKFHAGLKATISPSPGCKNCLLGCRQLLHPGLYENLALRPKCTICIKGIQRAKIALEMGAKSARLVSAKFARDSYNYLINDSSLLYWSKISMSPLHLQASSTTKHFHFLETKIFGRLF